MDKLIARTTVSQNFFGEGVFPFRAEGLQISELPLAGIIRIQGNTADEAFSSAVVTALATPLPAPERVSATRDIRLAWAGPGECLCFCALESESSVESALNESLAGQFATVTLVSDSRVAFLVAGKEAPALLAQGCSIDTHPATFGVDNVVTTRFAGLPAMLMHRDQGEYVLYFDVGYTEFVVKWLLEAAEEFVDQPA
jgi:sarcosine oxidase, subunit gamma